MNRRNFLAKLLAAPVIAAACLAPKQYAKGENVIARGGIPQTRSGFVVKRTISAQEHRLIIEQSEQLEFKANDARLMEICRSIMGINTQSGKLLRLET